MLKKLAKISKSTGLSKEQEEQAQLLMERNPELIEKKKKEKGIQSRPGSQNKGIFLAGGAIICALFC